MLLKTNELRIEARKMRSQKESMDKRILSPE